MASKSYTVYESALPKLWKLIEKLNKRAAKLGLAPLVLTEGDQIQKRDEDGLIVRLMRQITIGGETPKLDGWEFVATIQHAGEAGNILRTVPTFEGSLPEEFRTSDPGRCDHCKQYRRRTDTFVVAHEDGRFAQVGRQCLQDFLGGRDPHAVAAMAEMWSLVDEAASAFGEDDYGRSSGEGMLILDEAIAFAAEAMLRFGWLSKSKAEAQNKTATAELARTAMLNRGKVCDWKCADPCLSHFEPSEHAVKLTEAALAWAPEWIERESAKPCATDYIWNMRVVLANDVIPARSFNLAASVLGCYQRDLDRAEALERTRNESTSEYIGTVGERRVMTLTTKAFRFLDTDYGVSTLITYHDEHDNVVKWFASGEHEIDLDVTETVEATIKEHRDWNGVKETHVNRVKPYITPEEKKERAKLRKAAKAEYDRLQALCDEAYAAIPNTADSWSGPERAAYITAHSLATEAYKAWKAL